MTDTLKDRKDQGAERPRCATPIPGGVDRQTDLLAAGEPGVTERTTFGAVAGKDAVTGRDPGGGRRGCRHEGLSRHTPVQRACLR